MFEGNDMLITQVCKMRYYGMLRGIRFGTLPAFTNSHCKPSLTCFAPLLHSRHLCALASSGLSPGAYLTLTRTLIITIGKKYSNPNPNPKL